MERSTGADELLPLLILLLIQANPPSLHSNLSFIANCRHPSRLNGEQVKTAYTSSLRPHTLVA